ncbi:MAG: MFS transporter [Burkholderiales bacterium]
MAGEQPQALTQPSRYLDLAAIALVLAVCYGIWYAYSVIMVRLLQEFGWSRSVLAGAFSVFTLVHGMANPLVGTLCDRVRPERLMAWGGAALGLALWADSHIQTPLQLYLAFGVVTAASVAACGWVPAVVQVQRRFKDRLGLSLGIVSAGVGAGMLLVVPLTQLLIELWDWRTAFRAMGLLCAVFIVPTGIYLERRAAATRPAAAGGAAAAAAASATATRGAMRELTLAGAARTAPFWLIVGAFFFGNLCSQMLHVHQAAFLVDHGLSAMVAASVVGAVGAASIVGKIGGGWLSDRIEREFVYVAGIAILVGAVGALAAVGASPSRWGAYGYAVMLGVGYSVTASLTPAMASDRFGGRHFGAIVGAGLLASALGSALGPWMAGWMFDATGSYAVPFMIAAACGVAAGIAGWIARTLRLRASA